MIEHFIFALLDGDAPLTAFVDSRIYPILLPQNAVFPCVSYSTILDEEDKTFDGQGTFQEITVEIDAWSDTHAEMLSVGDAIKTAIKNYSGTLASVQVDAIYIDSTVSVYEDAAEKFRQTIIATIHKR